MNSRKRQMLIFVGFMTLFVIVFLFMFVYNPAPIDTSSDSAEETVNETNKSGIIHASIEGWKAAMNDFGKGSSVATGSNPDS